MASCTSTSGGSIPVLSTLKMKWSLTLPHCTRSDHVGSRKHSRHMVQLLGLEALAAATASAPAAAASTSNTWHGSTRL